MFKATPTRTRRCAALLTAALGLAMLTGCTPPPRAPVVTPSPTASATVAPLKPISLPKNPRVYFFGDSWTHGAVAAPGQGFPQVLGKTLGWQVEVGPDNSGSGFVHTYVSAHPLFPEKAAALKPFETDLIVLEGGINDQPGPLDNFWDSVKDTVTTLRAKAGGAPIVIVGPVSPDGMTSEGLSAIDYEESKVAEQLGVHYISAARERWFTPENATTLVDAKTFHPNTAGHAYYAGRLAAALEAITMTE